MSSHGLSLPRSPLIPLAALAGLGLWAWSQRIVKAAVPANPDGDVKTTTPTDRTAAEHARVLLAGAPPVGRRFYAADGGCSGMSPATGTLKSIPAKDNVFVRAIPAAERTRLLGFGYQVGTTAFVDETGKLFVYVQHYPDYLYVPFGCLTTVAPPAIPGALPKLYTRVCGPNGCAGYREPQDIGEGTGPAPFPLPAKTPVDVVAVQGSGSVQIRFTQADGTPALAWVRSSDLEPRVIGTASCNSLGKCRVYATPQDAENDLNKNGGRVDFFLASDKTAFEVLDPMPELPATSQYLKVRQVYDGRKGYVLKSITNYVLVPGATA